MMAEAPVLPVIMPPKPGKKGKGKAVNTAMVLNSLTPTLPIVMPSITPQLEDTAKSAPNSPEREGRKSMGFMRKHFGSRPKSPTNLQPNRTSHSDPESSPAVSPQTRPRWLPFKSKKRKSTDCNMNNGEPEAVDLTAMSGASFEPEATPVEELPGRTPVAVQGSNVPEIRVSSEGHDPNAAVAVTFDDISNTQDPYRKNSQSSRCSSGSGLMSVATSGIGSCLSPSGDEGSDMDSPLSPCSRTSSFTEEDGTGEISDTDPIDKDIHNARRSPSTLSGSNDNLSVTTPTPTSDSPPNTLERASMVSPTSPEEKLTKKKRDKPSNKNVWDKLRTAVKAWSPFRVQFKKKSYPWVQLAGHEGNFMPGGEMGTIMKKSGENERNALRQLLEDPLRNFVPEFKREVEHNGEFYVEMTDLLREFNEPAVMDIKMGIRTYLEEELGKKNVLRNDMYLKMIDVDPNEPTPEEHAQAGITKQRYMQWRESLSSTSTLGFRIEGIKTMTGKALKDFKKTKTSEEVREALQNYLSENPAVKGPFYKRLMDIRAALNSSQFFTKNELIGSSLLFVYDNTGLASINMIDFGKTTPLPEGIAVTHNSEWVEGNHEDGYLYGLDNLIKLWQSL